MKLDKECINRIIQKGMDNGYFVNGGQELFREMLNEFEVSADLQDKKR
jgi:hypothetical protein